MRRVSNTLSRLVVGSDRAFIQYNSVAGKSVLTLPQFVKGRRQR
jgi:hypothetical protein